ncbi:PHOSPHATIDYLINOSITOL-GLYCAN BIOSYNTHESIS CLASS X PROTEIN [Salix purpurea]|uniref:PHOSPHATIDYLINOSITOL-GLYCAN BIOSYNTHESIS CLASS X PROTEIN n=1 Tax=Salix purpurea TaxID=77065 RepID=A0A9Q0T956_SALPP|nr:PHOSPHATIDYLINOSITOL-GLYCAN BIOSYNTHESIS CLASS X PROTEIN [Salix purpurea]
METPRHFKCYNRQKVGILLIFSVGFGLFLQSSSSSSETTCESSSNFNNSYCGFRKYIMKSYFEKYDSLLEPIFQNFIADELFNTCKLLPDNLNHLVRVSVPWRHLIGEGSHRQISTTIRFHLQSDSMSWLRAHFCKVIVIERLPTGVFADPFELQHLLKRGVFTDVAVFGDTNLELPSVLSNRSAVEIHMNVAPTSLLGHKNELEISAELPLHVRYPPLDDSGYSEVKFGEPEIFLSCSVEENGDHESCFLVPTKDRTGSRTDDVVWRIPSGTRAHAGIVSAVTFLAASISTLLIVLSSVFYSDNKLGNNPKES